jgi:hypothetical protein
LVIPQVDFEGAIYSKPNDPLPYLDFEKIQWERVVEKRHRALFLENSFLRVTVLPEMGRVYSMVFKPTGHETLWHNDIAQPGRANNETGWWLWMGGIEYTLPRDEHGTTWALPWNYSILEDSGTRKALRMRVAEPSTGLEESITFSLYPDIGFLEAEIQITNPGSAQVEFAHWVNPMWVPGGRNELTDNTEFILPTKRILVEERWQKSLGTSPQSWPANSLRFIKNWKVGDIMADGLEAGFYGAYSHDAKEGVVRVFDPLKNPGVDIWTYGFQPQNIPMGSGAPNKGYVEIWGGTVKHFPNELGPLEGGGQLSWTEWIYPFQLTEGIGFANQNAVANLVVRDDSGEIAAYVCPTRSLEKALVEVRSRGEVVFRDIVSMSPGSPYTRQLVGHASTDLLLRLCHDGFELLRCQPSSWSRYRSAN